MEKEEALIKMQDFENKVTEVFEEHHETLPDRELLYFNQVFENPSRELHNSTACPKCIQRKNQKLRIVQLLANVVVSPPLFQHTLIINYKN